MQSGEDIEYAALPTCGERLIMCLEQTHAVSRLQLINLTAMPRILDYHISNVPHGKINISGIRLVVTVINLKFTSPCNL